MVFVLPEDKIVAECCKGCDEYIDFIYCGKEPDSDCQRHWLTNTEYSCPYRVKEFIKHIENNESEITKPKRKRQVKKKIKKE